MGQAILKMRNNCVGLSVHFWTTFTDLIFLNSTSHPEFKWFLDRKILFDKKLQNVKSDRTGRLDFLPGFTSFRILEFELGL